MIMRQVLRWKYILTTLGHQTIEQNLAWSILNFLKIIIIDKYQVKLFSFLPVFSFDRFGKQKLFQNFGRLYLGQMWEMDAMEVTQGGPDTHDDLHKKGAARTAARPFLVQKKAF